MNQRLHYIANARIPTEKAHGLQIAKTCEALADQGFEVILVHARRATPISSTVYDAYRVRRNFKIRSLPCIDTVRFGYVGFWIEQISFSVSVFLYVLAHRNDIIYARDEVPLFGASLVASRTFWESHTGRFDALIARLLRRMSGLIVITQASKKFYEGKGVPTSKIHVAPDAIALHDFAQPQRKEDARRRLGLSVDAKIALYIGRLDGWKGAETFAAASEHMGDIRAVLIGGESKDAARLQKKYPRAIFLGARPYEELADNQAAADVLVLPNTGTNEISIRHTSPLKLFTYLVSQRPIVASDLPSIREIVSEREVFFFKPDDAVDLARVISHVLESPEEAHAKAALAYSLGLGYTWQSRAEKMAQFLRNSHASA